MTKEQLELLIEYIDAKIEYAIASNEEGSDGYKVTAHNERKVVENIKSKLDSIINKL